MFAIVDLETTGGTARSHKVIEVAIVISDGTKVLDTYTTLINPKKTLPPFITSLTGITNDMLRDAPAFEDVANHILQKTEGMIFVAHNVNFDYSFLKQEFAILDQKFDRKKLCTVRLAKKILPGFNSYGLGSLTSRLGITIHDRHRALGDAMATVEVLKLLIKNDVDNFIEYSLKRNSREATLPSHLPGNTFDMLPEKSGVYYFHNSKGKVVYVGKAKNIKSRVLGHFTGESGTGKRLFHENIHNISYELTGNELIALLLESREIKRLWPEYNRAQKFTSRNHGLYEYTDQNGYRRLAISKTQPGTKPIATFKDFQEIRSFVNDLSTKFKLCPKLCGLQKSVGVCFDHRIAKCDGACAGKVSAAAYNERVTLAMASMDEQKKTYAIIGDGRNPDERSLVLVENGEYIGHGYTDFNLSSSSFEELKDRITTYQDNQDIQKILRIHLENGHTGEVIYF